MYDISIDLTDSLDRTIGKMIAPARDYIQSYSVSRLEGKYGIYYSVKFVVNKKIKDYEVCSIMDQTHDLFEMLGPKKEEFVKTIIVNNPFF